MKNDIEAKKRRNYLIKSLNEWEKNNFLRYREFLIKNGANKEILEQTIIEKIIIDVIKRVDLRVKLEGRTPFSYENPREDGTFSIKGRTNGPITSEIYDIKYCHDDNPEHFLEIKKTEISPYNIYEPNFIGTIYINNLGEIIQEKESTKKRTHTK